MPSVAFIVHVNLSDVTPQSLALTADDVFDDLVGGGHDVASVAPWQRPSLETALPPPQDFPANPQTTPAPPTLF